MAAPHDDYSNGSGWFALAMVMVIIWAVASVIPHLPWHLL